MENQPNTTYIPPGMQKAVFVPAAVTEATINKRFRDDSNDIPLEWFDEGTIRRLAMRKTAEEVATANSQAVFKNLINVEVNGVESSTNGRACERHLCCGHYVRCTDKLVCKWGMQRIDESPTGKDEEVVFVHALDEEGYAGCHIGYIPRHYFPKYGAKAFDLAYLKVTEDYRKNNNSAERHRSYKSNGLLLCKVIRDNSRYNGNNPFEGEACDVSISDYTSTSFARGIPGHEYEPKKKRGKKQIFREKPHPVYHAEPAPLIPYVPTAINITTNTSGADSIADSLTASIATKPKKRNNKKAKITK
jgi:hypothetical protein